jgi:hypothetical protein
MTLHGMSRPASREGILKLTPAGNTIGGGSVDSPFHLISRYLGAPTWSAVRQIPVKVYARQTNLKPCRSLVSDIDQVLIELVCLFWVVCRIKLRRVKYKIRFELHCVEEEVIAILVV